MDNDAEFGRMRAAVDALRALEAKHHIVHRFPLNLYTCTTSEPTLGLPWDAETIHKYGRYIPDQLCGVPVRFVQNPGTVFIVPTEAMVFSQPTPAEIAAAAKRQDMLHHRAQRAMGEILADLTDRRGLKGAWQDIDEEIQDEIRGVWTECIVDAMRPFLVEVSEYINEAKIAAGARSGQNLAEAIREKT